jgi:hypothetical protein
VQGVIVSSTEKIEKHERAIVLISLALAPIHLDSHCSYRP